MVPRWWPRLSFFWLALRGVAFVDAAVEGPPVAASRPSDSPSTGNAKAEAPLYVLARALASVSALLFSFFFFFAFVPRAMRGVPEETLLAEGPKGVRSTSEAHSFLLLSLSMEEEDEENEDEEEEEAASTPLISLK